MSLGGWSQDSPVIWWVGLRLARHLVGGAQKGYCNQVGGAQKVMVMLRRVAVIRLVGSR